MTAVSSIYPLLCLLLVSTVEIVASINHYLQMNPNDANFKLRLKIGFEEALVGTANLPIALFDAVNKNGTFYGRYRYLPWSKFFVTKVNVLFEPSYMNFHHLKIDDEIFTYTPNYGSHSPEAAFLMFRFITRFIETFMHYDNNLRAKKTRKSETDKTEKVRDVSGIDSDLLSQMYNFFYCQALTSIGEVNNDKFNRCPNPCMAMGQGLSSHSSNPCIGRAELANKQCEQTSRLWRSNYKCNCRRGFHWHKETEQCRSEDNFLNTVWTRIKHGVAMDTLSVISDRELPDLIGEYEIAVANMIIRKKFSECY